ncbi:MAG: WD40 repeat domain-containing protein, partial [Pirellulaceae bacterium]|nr:WD40 repeat domain-containing protein [Pirellulaceae bacterium]
GDETLPSATDNRTVPRRLWLGMYGLLDARTGETLAVMGFEHNQHDMSKRVGSDPNNAFSGPLSFVKDGPFGERCAYYVKNHPPMHIRVRSGWSSLPRRGHWTVGNGIVPGRIGFSRDGSLVAGGGKVGIVEIWDRDGVAKATLDGHIHGVTFLTFLPHGWRDSYRTHDARKPRESFGEGPRLDGSHALGAYRSDGPFELLTVDGHTTFRIWNTEGRLLGQWQTPEARKAVSYRIDPQGVGLGWDYDDRSWQYGYQCLDLSSDGRTIACRNFLERKPKGQAWLLDLATGERRDLKPRGAMKHVEPIDSAAFTLDGEMLVSAGSGKDGRIIVWAMPEGRPRKMFTPGDHSGQCRDLILSSDGKKAAAVTGGNVRIWDISEFPIGQ